MSRRIKLQSKLEELLGSRNVYYQSPGSENMSYPAIVYSKKNIDSAYANDANYLNHTSYEIIVIDKKPDNKVINDILSLPLSSYDRPYKANNLYHDVLTLYF